MALTLRKRKSSVHFTYQTLNIKLLSDERHGKKAYSALIRDIFDNSVEVSIGRGKKVLIRTLLEGKYEKTQYFFGKISKYSELESDKWLNKSTKEVSKFDIPEMAPNLQETDFVFVPDIHRFMIRKRSAVSINNAYEFFCKSLIKVLNEDEQYNVIIEQSSDIFDQIYNAPIVEKLEIEITYTNSDIIKGDAHKWVDKQLKKAQAKKVKILVEANQKKELNLDAELLQGSMDLAKNNGQVEATIRDINGRKRKIVTREHPQDNKAVASSDEEIPVVIVSEALNRYRDGLE